jgi:hypothetical protein
MRGDRLALKGEPKQSKCPPYFLHENLMNWIANFLALIAFVPASSVNLPPGTGTRVDSFSDNFEDRNWSYTYNAPKVYNRYHNPGSGWVNEIPAKNAPFGQSTNNKWHEGQVRGQPDIVEQVPTPSGGIPGSQYALRLATKDCGTPNVTRGTLQQDDLLLRPGNQSVNLAKGKGVSVVTRIYVPPLSEWENRQGYHIGFRVGATGEKNGKSENYWPGIWIWFNNKAGEQSYQFVVRANEKGEDAFASDRRHTRGGWWTLGMAFNEDGSISYYASPGVDDLKASDILAYRAGSQSAVATYKAYGLEFQDLDYVFFSLGSNDGQWATEFIVDDVAVYRISS